MSGLLFALLIIAMLAVVGVLFFGLFSMARGGPFNQRNANKLMRWRVALQGIAILLFVLFMMLYHQS
jgi:uncharacterized BrkB/YihY/UPF0761 family membrane protein